MSKKHTHTHFLFYLGFQTFNDLIFMALFFGYGVFERTLETILYSTYHITNNKQKALNKPKKIQETETDVMKDHLSVLI